MTELLKIGTRKTQEIEGTKFVSVPKVWVDHMDLRRGDWVECFVGKNDELIIKKRGE